MSTLLAPNFLLLEGDAADNHLQIKGGQQAGEFTVQGAKGTTVDGARRQSFSGIDRISLLLRDGDDSVSVSNLTLSNVNVAPPLALAGLLVWGGDGDDEINISNITVTADATGSTLDAQAFVTVQGDDAGGVGGSDTIRISNANVEATGDTRTFAQIDVFGDIATSTGGDDTAVVRNSHVFAHGGLTSNLALIDLQELSGAGDDNYSVLNSDVVASGASAQGRVVLEMGDGNDTGLVRNSSFDRLQARMGAGSDRLVLRNNDIGLLAFLDGGDDDDTLISKKNSGTINSINFEN